MNELKVIAIFAISASLVYLGLSVRGVAPLCFAAAVFCFGVGIAMAIKIS